MNIEHLKQAIESPATSPKDRDAAWAEFRAKTQGEGLQGSETDSLKMALLRETGAQTLGDVPYHLVQPFCAARGWTADVWTLYNEWLYEAAPLRGKFSSAPD